MQPIFWVVMGVSGSGKDTLIRNLLTRFSAMRKAVSHTTRAPRPAEVDGSDYHFVTAEKFQALIDSGEMVEWVEAHGQRYGLTADEIKSCTETGDGIVDSVGEGVSQLAAFSSTYNIRVIYLVPPDPSELLRRMKEREPNAPEAKLRQRIENGAREAQFARLADYRIAQGSRTEMLAEAIRIIGSCRD